MSCARRSRRSSRAVLWDAAGETELPGPSSNDDPFHRKHKLQIWDRFYEDGDKDILGHAGLVIAKDGGVSDIHDLDYSMMYVQALLLCVFLVVNVVMIIRADLNALLGVNLNAEEREATSGFLLSKHLFNSMGVATWLTRRFDELIPLLELLSLCAVGGRLLWRAGRACYQGCMQFREPSNHSWELMKWTNVSRVFWESVPEVSSFSAMRLLYYVTPTVMATQAYNHVDLAVTKFQRHNTWQSRILIILPLFRYVAMCICCLLIGFDAFLIKFRVAQSYVTSYGFHWGNVFQAAVFLYQVLGVVNLNWFVRERLCIFIFGGEDGKVDADEKARWEVWHAMLAKEIYHEFGSVIGTAMMLGFDDYDFQSLVLDDHGKQEKLMARSLSKIGGKTALARLGSSPAKRTEDCGADADGAVDPEDLDLEEDPRWRPADGPAGGAADGALREPLLAARAPPRAGPPSGPGAPAAEGCRRAAEIAGCRRAAPALGAAAPGAAAAGEGRAARAGCGLLVRLCARLPAAPRRESESE